MSVEGFALAPNGENAYHRVRARARADETRAILPRCEQIYATTPEGEGTMHACMHASPGSTAIVADHTLFVFLPSPPIVRPGSLS